MDTLSSTRKVQEKKHKVRFNFRTQYLRKIVQKEERKKNFAVLLNSFILIFGLYKWILFLLNSRFVKNLYFWTFKNNEADLLI